MFGYLVNMFLFPIHKQWKWPYFIRELSQQFNPHGIGIIYSYSVFASQISYSYQWYIWFNDPCLTFYANNMIHLTTRYLYLILYLHTYYFYSTEYDKHNFFKKYSEYMFFFLTKSFTHKVSHLIVYVCFPKSYYIHFPISKFIFIFYIFLMRYMKNLLSTNL